MNVRSLPLVGEPPRLGKLGIRTHTWTNGVTLACVEQRDLPIVDVEIVVRAGAAADSPGQAGRAAMVAEMLDEGTRTRSVMEIAEGIDYLGAHLGLHAGWDSTTASLHVLSNRLHAALDIMLDVMLTPSFPPAEFERKKRERLTALLQECDEARVAANKALTLGVFGPHHPYGLPVGGTHRTLSALELADVEHGYRAHWQPPQVFVVVAGDVGFDDIVGFLDERLGSWRGSAPPPPVLPEAPAASRARVILVDKPRAAQAEIRVGHAGPARSTPDYFPLVVLNTMLGGAFTSRLNLRLREEMGVTYGASSRFGWRRQGGIFWASSAVASDAAAESVGVMLTEMRRLRDEPIDTGELERAARYLAYGLPRSFESTEDIAAHVREQMLHDLPADYWQTYVDQVLAVTAGQVQAAAARHLHPERATAVVVADRAQVARSLEQLQLGDVVMMEVEA